MRNKGIQKEKRGMKVLGVQDIMKMKEEKERMAVFNVINKMFLSLSSIFSWAQTQPLCSLCLTKPMPLYLSSL